MKTFIVTLHTPALGGTESGLVTIITPSGMVEARVIAPDKVDDFARVDYIPDLIRRMYPGKANKIQGDTTLFRYANFDGTRLIEVFQVDCDD